MKLIFDTVDNKNTIGNDIEEVVNNGVKKTMIVSPYISKLHELINIEKIDKIKIICNAESNSCNPFTLYDLIKNDKIQIKSRNDIHAKVYIFDDIGFITSANATSNGLGIGSIEAASKITNKKSLNNARSWFSSLWKDTHSQNISDYSEEKWQELKSKWKLRKTIKKKKPQLYDLIITKSIPENTSFIFWNSADEDMPDKEIVERQAKTNDIIELPDNIKDWDYFVEEDNYKKGDKSFDKISDILSKYYDHTIINLKKNHNSGKVVKIDSFVSKLVNKPILIKHKKISLLLALYRTNNIYCDFVIDQKSIELINRSKTTNSDEWYKYLECDDGIYGYCTSNQLYKLVNGCL